jgi:Glycosyl transferase family 2
MRVLSPVFLKRLQSRRYLCFVLAIIVLGLSILRSSCPFIFGADTRLPATLESTTITTVHDHHGGIKESMHHSLASQTLDAGHLESNVQNTSIVISDKVQSQHHHQPLHLVICAVVKDEAPYLQEWLEHHRMLGFDEIFLFNDGSTDETQCIMNAYAAKKDGFVERIPQDVMNNNNSTVPFLSSQPFDQCSTIRACEEYLRNRGGSIYRNTWMLTHDVDEFIWFNNSHTTSTTSKAEETGAVAAVPGDESSFKNFLRRLIHENEQCRHRTSTTTPSKVRSLNIPRLVFGSSDHDHHEPNSLVMERFTHRYSHEGCPPRNRRPVWKTDFYHTSYCDVIYMAKNSIDNVKSMTWAPALPTSCRKNIVVGCELAHGQHDDRQRCITPHIHKLQQLPNMTLRKSQDAVPAHALLDTVAIMHYATKSREEFFDRTCKSVWLSKYTQCDTCSPEAAFNVTQSNANNYKDERMLPFAARIRNVMSEIQQQQKQQQQDEMTFPVLVDHCNIQPPQSHRGWDYYRDCWRNRMNATKKSKPQ